MLSLEDEALISIILANNRRIDEILKKQSLGGSQTTAGTPTNTPSPPPPPPPRPPPPPPQLTIQTQREGAVPRIELPQLDFNPNAIVEIITNDSMADDMPTLDLSCGSEGTDSMSISAGSTPPPPPPHPQSNLIVDHTLLPPPEEAAQVPIDEPIVHYTVSSIPGLGDGASQHSVMICDSLELDYYESQESDCGEEASAKPEGDIQVEGALVIGDLPDTTLQEDFMELQAITDKLMIMAPPTFPFEVTKAFMDKLESEVLESVAEPFPPVKEVLPVETVCEPATVEPLVQRQDAVPGGVAETAFTDSIPESSGGLLESNYIAQPISDELTAPLKPSTQSIIDKAKMPIQVRANNASGSGTVRKKKVFKVRLKKVSSDNEGKGTRTKRVPVSPTSAQASVLLSPAPVPNVANDAAETPAVPPAIPATIVSDVEDEQEGVISEITIPVNSTMIPSAAFEPSETSVIPERQGQGSESGSDFGRDFVVVDDFNNDSFCQEQSTNSQELKNSHEPSSHEPSIALSGSQDAQLHLAGTPGKKKKGKRKVARRKPKLAKKGGAVTCLSMTETNLQANSSDTLKAVKKTPNDSPAGTQSGNLTVKPSIREHISTHVDSALITDLRLQLERKGLQQSTSGKQKAARPLQELSLPCPPDVLSNRPYTRSNSRSPDLTTRSPLIRTVAGIKRQTSPLLAVRPAKAVCPEVYKTPEKLNTGRVLLETPPILKLALRPEELSIVCWEHCPTKQKYPRSEEAFIVHLNKDHTNPNIVFSLPNNQIVCVCVKCEAVVKYTRFSKDKHVKEKHQNTDVTVFYIYIEDAADGDFGITHVNAPMQRFSKVGYFESFTTDASLDTIIWQDVRGLSFCYHYCGLCHQFVRDSFSEVESHVKSRQHTSKITWKL